MSDAKPPTATAGPSDGSPPSPTPHDEPVASLSTNARRDRSGPTIFQFPRYVHVVSLILFIGLLFVVGAAPHWYGWLLVIPIVISIWAARVRTVVTPRSITVERLFGSRTEPWSNIKGLKIGKAGSIEAKLISGGSMRLTAVTFAQLPSVSRASGGHLPNPYEGLTEPQPH